MSILFELQNHKYLQKRLVGIIRFYSSFEFSSGNCIINDKIGEIDAKIADAQGCLDADIIFSP